MEHALPVFFALVLAFGIGMYVIADGFDLGIGILFTLAPGDTERDEMMNSIAPVWDGNETWLVLGGTLLLGAFPVVYSVVLPSFYIPIMVMLFALIFRGIAFEFRFRASRFRIVWDWAFCLGSGLAALMQGMMLGSFIGGVAPAAVSGGGILDFLSGFAIASGLGTVAGYSLLGATWLILRTENTVQAFARRAAPWALGLTLAFIALISIWTPLIHQSIAHRWFSMPNIFYLSPVPLLTALLGFSIWRAIPRQREERPFILTILLFLLAYLGLGISIWPYAIPQSVTIWQAASSTPTLIFLGVGTLIFMPIVIGHLGYAHWVFRGKTTSNLYGH
ncbi:MAG: cydB [Rhodospirillales bacterium]|nr:cydB [Rhodospirillales bacterium]